MSLTRASLAGTLPGRSLKTARMPWFANGQTLIGADTTGFTSGSTPATPNTKGGWVQIIASTSADCGLIMLAGIGTQSATDRSVLVDIGIGAAGAETPIVQNVPIGGADYSVPIQLPLPVFVPQGSRISWRGQAALASASFAGIVSVNTYRTGDNTFTPRSLDTLGASTSTSRGTAMSGAAGTYTQITSATPQPYQALLIVPNTGDTTGLPNANCTLTLGVGPAGSEVPIGTVVVRTNGGTVLPANYSQPFMLSGRSIPAGTRIAVAHTLSSNPQNLQVAVIGVPYR